MSDDLYIPIDDDLRSALPWMNDDYLAVVQQQIDHLEGAPEAQQTIVNNWNRAFDVVMRGNQAIEIATRYTLGNAKPEALEIFDLGNGKGWERPQNQLPPVQQNERLPAHVNRKVNP